MPAGLSRFAQGVDNPDRFPALCELRDLREDSRFQLAMDGGQVDERNSRAAAGVDMRQA
ncbi:MAG: hypothetical protein M3P18_23905 [Actinomycetota bacterium]|nr:hypothetical protein [Actinomycetota bacterium]